MYIHLLISRVSTLTVNISCNKKVNKRNSNNKSNISGRKETNHCEKSLYFLILLLVNTKDLGQYLGLANNTAWGLGQPVKLLGFYPVQNLFYLYFFKVTTRCALFLLIKVLGVVIGNLMPKISQYSTRNIFYSHEYRPNLPRNILYFYYSHIYPAGL